MSSMAKAHWGILKMSLGNANHMGRFVQPSALLAFIHDQGISMSQDEFDDATDEGAETGDLVEHQDGRYRLATQVTSKRERERDAARTAAAAASKKKKKKKKKKSKAQKTKAGKSVAKGKSIAAKKVPAAAGLSADFEEEDVETSFSVPAIDFQPKLFKRLGRALKLPPELLELGGSPR